MRNIPWLLGCFCKIKKPNKIFFLDHARTLFRHNQKADTTAQQYCTLSTYAKPKTISHQNQKTNTTPQLYCTLSNTKTYFLPEPKNWHTTAQLEKKFLQPTRSKCNCSMYHVPVPTLFGYFVWLYFKQLITSCWQRYFLRYKLEESPNYLIPIPMYLCKFVWLSFKQLVHVADSIIFGIQTRVASKVSNTYSYVEKIFVWAYFKQLALIFPALVFAYKL
jgi:hypothetical protein